MTLEALRKLIATGEGETLEFKATTGQREDACETLCGYLNKDGGTVIFGVTRKGELTGQFVSDKTKRELFEVFAKFEPSADIAVDWVDVESGSNLDQNLDHADPDPIQIDPDVDGDIPRRLLSTLRRNPLISRKLLAVELNVSERKIRDSLKILKDSGVIVRQGPDHGGIWRISHIVAKTKRHDTINTPHNEAVNESVNGLGEPVNGTINQRCEGINRANEAVNEVVSGHREVVNEVVKTVLEAIKTKPGIKKPELQKITGKSHATIERAVDLLKKRSEIEYRGSDKTGGYYAVK